MTPPPTTVVLVDDAPEVRALVRTHLRLSGRFVVVGEGGTGQEAVALAGEHRPGLMLLDVSMPQMDGLEALPLVLAAAPATRVVLFSGFDERGLAARGRRLGAAGFVEKSLPADRLAHELLAVLAGPPRPDAPAGPTAPADRTAPDDRTATRGVLGEDLERFREVFEEAAIGMATMTLAGRVVRANRALAAVVGCSPDELVGVPYADLATPGDADRVRGLVAGLDRGETAVAQVEHGLAGHPHRRVAATLATVRGGRGRPLYLSLQVQDITAQHRSDEQLRQSEERFRLLVEAVEDYAIFMLDRHGHVASWNAGAERIKGYAASEIIGHHFRRFYPVDQQRTGHPEHELRLALRDGSYEEEGWRVRKDGSTFWANVVITAVRNSAGEHVGFAKVTRDITERRAAGEQRERAAAALATAAAELEAMNARLLRAAAAQSQFVAVTAHELRTPVAVLAGSAGTLAQHWRDLHDEERTELVDGMVHSAARLRRLLADLLAAARLEAGAMDLVVRPVRVADVLAEAAAVARQGRPAEDVVVHVDPDLRVLADHDRVAQAVDNLVGNALRHGAPPVRLSASAQDGVVRIRVQDEGPGVDPEVRARLFDRFATGERISGTGLGLFIVRELARAQGGDAWYDDDATPGAFVLSLPQATDG